MVPFLGIPGKLNTLLSRLTSGRATAIDHLDADITSRAAASTWSSALASKINTNLDAAVSGRAPQPQVRTGWIPIGTTTSTGTGEETSYYSVTLASAVTATTNCVVLFNGGLSDNSSAALQKFNNAASFVTYEGNARMVSTTELLISCSKSADYIAGRWIIIDYGGCT